MTFTLFSYITLMALTWVVILMGFALAIVMIKEIFMGGNR